MTVRYHRDRIILIKNSKGPSNQVNMTWIDSSFIGMGQTSDRVTGKVRNKYLNVLSGRIEECTIEFATTVDGIDQENAAEIARHDDNLVDIGDEDSDV
jgi:hypothetical protein